jgi:Na+/H+ antiporter NhaD/arsenite permease-like protein
MSQNKIFLKVAILALVVFILGIICHSLGFNSQQSLSVSIFILSVLGTMFFWEFRLAFAFIGTSILLVTKTIDLEHLILSSSLEVILFLVGMMVLIGLLKESGFFAWIITLILRIRNLDAKKFTFILSLISGLLACAVDEVTSIIFMVAAVLEVCDYFEVNPVPFIIISVLSTNIGSAGTVLGNPIGILIASKSGLTFEDFMLKAFPLMLLCLFVLIGLIMLIFRKDIRNLDLKMKELGANDILIRLISVPPDRPLKHALFIFGTTLFFVALHHRLEKFFQLDPNTILLIVPLIFSGLVMIWKWQRARKYIEQDVEWWTLLFFLLLFAQAGTLKFTGTTDLIAKNLVSLTGNSRNLLIGSILWISAIGSSILDNVVLVAAFIPIIQSFQNMHADALWWALLFGGCLGGNITLIGSTANIIALGILEKERNIKIRFSYWLFIGLAVGLATIAVVWACLIFLPIYK